MKRNKGFTLAELLVVVGIIAVLVAISIPVFTSQLHKARVATDWANLRALYAEIQTEYITNSEDYSFLNNYSLSNSSKSSYYDTIVKSDGTKVAVQAGYVHFVKPSDINDDSEYKFIITYTCVNTDSDHTLYINNIDGVIAGYKGS